MTTTMMTEPDSAVQARERLDELLKYEAPASIVEFDDDMETFEHLKCINWPTTLAVAHIFSKVAACEAKEPRELLPSAPSLSCHQHEGGPV